MRSSTCIPAARSIVRIHEALDVAGARTISCIRNTNACSTEGDGVDLTEAEKAEGKWGT